MFKKQELTRLGDILVSKGLISPAQLDIAIQEQSRRKKLLDAADPQVQVAPIGEILIELGFIDRSQLKRGLNWQQRLRRASIAMALCAPFMVFAPSASAQQTSSVATSSIASSAATVAPVSETLFPLLIRAEQYSAMKGVVTEPTVDVGGGKSVGYIDAGDSMTFGNHKFKAPFAGKYKIQYRVASASASGSFAIVDLTTGITLDTVTVTKTGGWQTWTTMEREISIGDGEHVLELRAVSTGFNINWIKIEPVATTMPLTITGSSYSSMLGIKTETSTDTGGGTNIAGVDTGDWFDYKNSEVLIPTSGKYKVTYRVAAVSSSAKLSLYEAGTTTVFDTINVPATGGWQKWVSVERIVTVPAGRHFFGIKAVSGGFNFNWVKFEPVDANGNVIGASSSSTAALQAVSSSSSSSAAVVSSAVSSSVQSSSNSSVSSAAVSSAAPVSTSSTPTAVSSSSSSASSEPSYHVGGSLAIAWAPPSVRENGNYLDITELGGYEIRYKKSTDARYTYISVTDPWTNRYEFESLPEGDYVFQIAAFDVNGIYSPFVNIR